MHFIQPDKHTRRAFLRRSAQLGLTGAALPMALNLAAIGEAAAFNNSDYKALVCVFLYGGNDYGNTVVTYDNASYDQYAAIRGGTGRAGGGIALAQAALAPTLLAPTSPLADGRQYALHPSMTGLANLFNTQKAAVQLNVGPLVVPLTRTQYNSANRVQYPLPPKLFSHNDQQSIWQSSSPEGSTVGWGGNLGDLALSSNSNSLFTCISVAGNAVFLSGDSALQYQVSTSGAIAIDGIKNSTIYSSTAVQSAFSALVKQDRGHALENAYNSVTKRAIGAESSITSGLAGAAMNTAFPTNNPLADQLKMVARLIAARSTLGANRQVFMVSLGGFDLHDNLISNQLVLMQRVSEAMSAFYQATVDLGVANKVTAFTASDFGRTLSSNGDGSDHGWGGHQLVVGGAVNGKAFYGKAPPVSVGNSATDANDQWHVGQGRLLPSTSVDQYAATLASWFGVSGTELAGVLPNLRNFGGADYPTNLGFML
ncbi:DUF1501 domain-containing protein [Acidovorax sp.]|uniref:DUF1501 domain-containing protein n=1 Tax=Acidovorax sp. TaxID=1872122 RepID=UPI00262F8FC9|nr:DUF1501 domain-containing protein [Acidovorax sp.]